MRIAALMFPLSLSATSLGCGGGDGQPSGPDASDETLTISCSTDPRRMAYSNGIAVVGKQSLLEATLVTADPAPPLRGSNTWTLKITGAHGAPVTGASITSISPFMPDHGHGTSILATATQSGDGSFTVAPLYLFMPGLWQITLGLKTDSATDTVVFSFCIAG